MIPAGITTATVHLDAPVSFIGDPGRIHVTIVPSVPLVWTATGTAVGNFTDNISLQPGVNLDIVLPHTDQPGFQDGYGNDYVGWYYTVTVVYEKDGQRIDFPPKDFQVLSGQETVDLALVPAGEAAPVPEIAPILPVTSLNGRTGAVTLDKADVGLGNADNTSDTAKPISILAQAALDLKAQADAKFFAPLAKAANAATVRSNWWIAGDSKEESYGATGWANRAFAQIQDRFRELFPSGAAGSTFRPGRYNVPGTGWDTTFTYSGVSTFVGIGFAHRGRQLSHDAANPGKATMTNVACTEIELFFWRLSADQVTISIDGGAPVTYTLPVTGSKASKWESGPLAKVNGADIHTIVITQTGGSNSAPVLAGVNLINGDKTKGLHFIDNTISGGKTSGFVGQTGDSAGTVTNKESWAEFIPLLPPELIVFEFLTNDVVTDSAALYEANVRKFIALARTKAGKDVPFLLMPPEEPSDRALVEPWANYLAALKKIAKDTVNVRFHDVSQRIPKQGAGNPNGIYMDAVHFAPHFQSVWADEHVTAILGPDRSRPVALSTAQAAELAQKVGKGELFLNVKDYGAKGDGVTDDSAGITAAVTALHTAGRGRLVFPTGSYRYAAVPPAGSAAVYINGLSNVTIEFAPDAELLMDNLNGTLGGGHGIHVRGAGSNIALINPRVRWKTLASARSFGDAIRFMGYPSDAAPPAAWKGSTGQLSRITVTNSRVEKAPQAGMVFHGCSDVQVTNHQSIDTMADGLHFNACRRTTVDGVAGLNPGDDTLAYVTYYHAADLWQNDTAGPFNQPALGEWSNTDSVATNINARGGIANGIRLAGALNVAVSNGAIDGCSVAGVVLDAGLTGGGFNWAYLASRGCTVENIAIRNIGGNGIHARVFNTTFAADPAFWTYGVTFRNITVRDSVQQNIRVAGSGVVNSGVSGISFNDVTVHGTQGTYFLGMRDGSIQNVQANGGSIFIYGSDTVDTSALAGRARNNLIIDNVFANGGSIFLQDLRDCSVGTLRSANAPAGAMVLTRCSDLEIDEVDIVMPNRSAAAGVVGIRFVPVQKTRIKHLSINYDGSGTGFSPFEIGGGGAADISSDLIIGDAVYRNALNQANLGAVLQGGAYGPKDYLYDFRFFNGGEASPKWRRERYGYTTWPEEFYMTGAPTMWAAVGSRYIRTDGSAGATMYVKQGGTVTDNVGWVAMLPEALTSSNGTKYKLTVGDDGALTTTAL